MDDRKIMNRKRNSGFSLITVLIAVSFIGILGMLMLYIAVANFQMKTTDLKGKDSFYTAERALEEIRTGLQKDVGEAMSKAFIQVLENYEKYKDSQNVAMDELRQSDFEDAFVKELSSRLKHETESGCYSLNYLKKYVDLLNSDDFDPSQQTLVVTALESKKTQKPLPLMISGKKSGVLLKNLKVIYVDSKGRASIITTDIRLGIPEVRFPTPSTLPDLMSMIIVAGGGIICENDTVKETTINGSVYAGVLENIPKLEDEKVSIWIKNNATVNVQNQYRLVCGGDIKVSGGSKFVSESGVSLWAQGINVDSSKELKLLGDTYLADDLTINGNGNQVTIEGNYYGYGYPDTAKSENYLREGQIRELKDAEVNSAIVINGKNTTLDLSGAKQIMLAGKNYISGSKQKPIEGTKNSNDIMTGESVTVKGTQLAYLLPVEIIDPKGEIALTNPMTYQDFKDAGFEGLDTVPVKWDTPVESWGGATLRELGVDSVKPVQEVFLGNNAEADKGYVYLYLNFTNDLAATKFMDVFYRNNPQMKKSMDKYISFYFNSDGTGININGLNTKFITNGNLLAYEGGQKAEGELQNATDPTTTQNLSNRQRNLQDTWFALKRKMVMGVDFLKSGVEDTDGISHDEIDGNVFDNLVNEKEMVQFIRDNEPESLKYVYADSSGLEAVMYHNGVSSSFPVKNGNTIEIDTVSGKDTPLYITKDDEDKLRLVVCTGDVVIKGDVNFKGIIMAKGKITLEAGATLEAKPLEAATVFNGQIDAVGVPPKKFFWEGEQYVVGNSLASGNNDNNNNTENLLANTYDLAECVTYENWKKQ